MSRLVINDIIKLLQNYDGNAPLSITVDVRSLKPELGIRVECDSFDIFTDDASDVVSLVFLGDWNTKF